MNRFLSIALICFFISQVNAQIATNSPYSRFGLGEIQQNIFPIFNAFGGASVAFSDLKIINPSNPATYTSFGPNSFLLSTGGWNQTTKIQNDNAEQISNNNSFSHLIFGFPLSKKIGTSVGMIPFSSTGYEINIRDEQNNSNLNYFGDGGLSKIYFGAAFKPVEALSIGINASYLFGGLNRRKKLIFEDESFLNSRSNSKINLKGYYYEIGLLYKILFNENDRLSLAITTNNNSMITAKKSEIIESFEFSGLLEVPIDTVLNNIEPGEVTLPKYLSTGFSYNKDKKWLFIAEYSMQNWADYTMFNETDNLVNSMDFSAGIQYTPEYNSITRYYKRMDYRFGVNLREIPLQFEGNQLKEMSISFGFGIPLRKSRTKYNFSCTLGNRGTTENGLIKEQFARIGLSVSYDGIWFVKRKYD